MTGPLSGIRVVEVSTFITGPYAGQLLADLGADVVKVEDPNSGDPFRSWGEGNYSPHFVAYNRSKRSLTLNLKRPAALGVFGRLVANADVLIENFRPGVADRLGIGYEQVKALNPAIVYCSISGLGRTGPAAGRPTYDTVGQAMTGLLSLFLNPADPRPIGPALSDGLTGIFAAYGILGALVARERTGEGQHVQTNMIEATLGFMPEAFSPLLREGRVPDPFWRPRTAGVHAFRCADGDLLAIHLSSPPKFWEGLTRVVGRDDLRDDPRFTTRQQRIEHYDVLRAELAAIFQTRPRAEWLRLLEDADVPAAPVYTLDQVLEDPQVRHLGVEQLVHHPTEGAIRMLGFPVRFTGTPLAPSEAPPTLGEHSRSVLHELGFGDSEIEIMHREGAI